MDIVVLATENLGPLLLSVVAIVATVILKKLANKYGLLKDIEAKNAIESLIDNTVAQGTAFAEQWAKNELKARGQGAKIEGHEKYDRAFKYIAEELRRNGIVELTAHEISRRIEAILGLTQPTMLVPDMFPPQGGMFGSGDFGFDEGDDE